METTLSTQLFYVNTLIFHLYNLNTLNEIYTGTLMFYRYVLNSLTTRYHVGIQI